MMSRGRQCLCGSRGTLPQDHLVERVAVAMDIRSCPAKTGLKLRWDEDYRDPIKVLDRRLLE